MRTSGQTRRAREKSSYPPLHVLPFVKFCEKENCLRISSANPMVINTKTTVAKIPPMSPRRDVEDNLQQVSPVCRRLTFCITYIIFPTYNFFLEAHLAESPRSLGLGDTLAQKESPGTAEAGMLQIASTNLRRKKKGVGQGQGIFPLPVAATGTCSVQSR